MISRWEEDLERFEAIRQAAEIPVRIPENNMQRPSPLIVALYGGPGVGKSTIASMVFGTLKMDGVNCEFVSEIAKGFTWEERWATLANQPYVIAKQLRDYDRLYGKVDCIVTDTSSLLGLVYGKPQATPEVTRAFQDWLVADWKARRTLNVLLHRDESRTYDAVGRYQDETEAKCLDSRIQQLLWSLDIPMLSLTASASHVDEIVKEVHRCLRP